MVPNSTDKLEGTQSGPVNTAPSSLTSSTSSLPSPPPLPSASGTLQGSSVTPLKNPDPELEIFYDINLLQRATKEMRSFNYDISNKSENVKNLNYIFNKISDAEKCIETLSLVKQSANEKKTRINCETTIKEFEEEFKALKKSVQYREYNETKKFIESIEIDYHLNDPLNKYSDLKSTNKRLAEDLYFQARKNLEEKGKTLHESEIGAEVERLIGRALELKKALFGDQKGEDKYGFKEKMREGWFRVCSTQIERERSKLDMNVCPCNPDEEPGMCYVFLGSNAFRKTSINNAILILQGKESTLKGFREAYR